VLAYCNRRARARARELDPVQGRGRERPSKGLKASRGIDDLARHARVAAGARLDLPGHAVTGSR
jgi:hypothetical protein